VVFFFFFPRATRALELERVDGEFVHREELDDGADEEEPPAEARGLDAPDLDG
jgi:hypothetical protein